MKTNGLCRIGVSTMKISVLPDNSGRSRTPNQPVLVRIAGNLYVAHLLRRGVYTAMFCEGRMEIMLNGKGVLLCVGFLSHLSY